MRTVNVHEAKAKFSEVLAATERGETVVICRRNVPIAEVRGIERINPMPRQPGLGPTAPGYQLPDTFWQPLDGDLVTAFAGGEMAQAE